MSIKFKPRNSGDSTQMKRKTSIEEAMHSIEEAMSYKDLLEMLEKKGQGVKNFPIRKPEEDELSKLERLASEFVPPELLDECLLMPDEIPLKLSNKSLKDLPSLVLYDKPITLQFLEEKTHLPNQKNLNDNMSTNDLLNIVFPPRCWKKNNYHYMQRISTKKGNREMLITLGETLSLYLQLTGARANGLCPLRHALHQQCLEEMIRQTIIEDASTGLSLLKLQDEMRMVNFINEESHKLAVDAGKYEMILLDDDKELTMIAKEYDEIEKQKEILEKRVFAAKRNYETIKTHNEEKEKNFHEKFAKEVEHGNKSIAQLQRQVAGIFLQKTKR